MGRGVLLLAAVALAAVATAPPAVAHTLDPDQDAIPHLTGYYWSLNATEAKTLPLDLDGAPIQEGAHLVLNVLADKDGAGVTATIANGSTVAASWDVPGDGLVYRLTARIPRDGVYVLNMSHLGDAEAPTRYWLFFDVSCACPAKAIPLEVPRGLVVFAKDVPPGDRLRVTVPEPAALALNVSVLGAPPPGGVWPAGADVAASSSSPSRVTDTEPRVRLHEIVVPTGAGGTAYVVVEAQGVDRAKLGTPTSTVVTPLFELQSEVAGTQATPWASGVVAVAAVVAAAAVAARRNRP